MHARAIQGVRAVRDAQEPRTLLEAHRTEQRNALQVVAVRKEAVRLAVRDDFPSHAAAEPRDARKQLDARRIDVDADEIHAVFDHGVETPLEFPRIDVVLVLTDPDRLRVDFDEFGERILQSAGDGNGAAVADVEPGEFLFREFRRSSESTSPTASTVSRLAVPLPIATNSER